MAAERQDPAALARHLARRYRSAGLATLAADQGGHPVVSLVTTACAPDGSPILLLSDLADHSRNLRADPRASLLFQNAGHLKNPQTGPRATFIGTLAATDDDILAQRFRARHPTAAVYADFADFRFYRMTVVSAHVVGGFARADHLNAAQVLRSGDWQSLARQETELLGHLNRDPAAVNRMAHRLGAKKGEGWQAVGIDPDGIDLRNARAFCRLDFDQPARHGDDIRGEIRRLQRRARLTA